MKKPTLGYPSRLEAVAALLGQGKTAQEISALIGISTKNVWVLVHYVTEGRVRANEPKVGISRAILDSLSEHAKKRGIHVNVLARRIITTVANENMINAVLDDGVA